MQTPMPIVVVTKNGIAVTEATNGIPVVQALNGRGLPVVIVASGGIPVSGSGNTG